MSLELKLQQIIDRHGKVAEKLNTVLTPDDIAKYSKEYSSLEPIVAVAKEFFSTKQGIQDASEMLSDPEMKDLAEMELYELKEKLPEIEQEIKVLLLPKDEADEKNAILEVRAGTGGDEAALFAGDLVRMYNRYADLKGWKMEILNGNEADVGGYKEISILVSGTDVFSRLKFESGVHRVQRVPDTESSGRIHTSAATVAVLPEAQEVDVDINPADLEIDTYRASGAGGQHVNTTDSAVRITHRPTGVVVQCQDERSQHKNKDKAMKMLISKIYEEQRRVAESEMSQNRKAQVGSGDRSERIRTYNFPQGRITDHRINLTLYTLESVLNGNLDDVIDALIAEDRALKLTALDE